MAPAPAAAAAAEQRRRPTSGADAPNAAADAIDATLPVIDLASDNNDDEAQSQLARDLRHACETVGSFFLENHGVPQELIDRTFAAARVFFALPDEEKQHCRAVAPILARARGVLLFFVKDPKP
jgi:isopenicillin N synthase-like dioxygenase